MATRVSAPITAPQPSMTMGLIRTVFIEVIMAVTKSMSLSISKGMAITVSENRKLASSAPATEPTKRNSAPSGVVTTTAAISSNDRVAWFCRKMASHSRTW